MFVQCVMCLTWQWVQPIADAGGDQFTFHIESTGS
jgi:pentose-5-phosphate-3-epimerase